MDGLREYRTKRTFDRMAEPTGNDLHEKQGIFVVAKHGATHYPDDFRLEIKDIPASWAVPKGPSMNSKD
jgi:bifunctional non-homologous end joining protein LigD